MDISSVWFLTKRASLKQRKKKKKERKKKKKEINAMNLQDSYDWRSFIYCPDFREVSTRC